jgi:hypothetical protein
MINDYLPTHETSPSPTFTEWRRGLKATMSDATYRPNGDPIGDAARADLGAMEAHHGAYLADTLAQTEELAAHHNLVSRPLNADASAIFTTQDGQANHQLSLHSLGLPDAPNDTTPIALLVHERDGQPTDLEVITEGGYEHNMGKHVRFSLQNPGAVDANMPDEPSWQLPNNAVVGRPALDIIFTEQHNADTQKGTLTISNHSEDTLTTVRVIRPKETRIERRLADTHSTEKSQHKNRTLKRLGGAVLAGMMAVLPMKVAANKVLPMSEAQEVVHPSGTEEVDGIKQAERFYDKDTLARSRAAFDAYFRGDTAELRKQAEQYPNHWMDETALARLGQATSYAELQHIFQKAVGDELDINLDVIDTDTLPAYLAGKSIEPVPDLASARTAALAAAQQLNNTSKDLLRTSGPLTVVAGGTITVQYGEETANSNDDYITHPVGTFTYNEDLKRSIIILDASSEATRDIFGHEQQHRSNDTLRGNLTYRILPDQTAWLNPEGHKYTGSYKESDYQNSPIIVDDSWMNNGNRVTSWSYGNVNAEEDTAVSSEQLNLEHPKLPFDKSTGAEKTYNVLFALEEAAPGTTAVTLLNAEPAPALALNERAMRAVEHNPLPLEAAGALILAGIAARIRGRKRRDGELQQYQPKS